MQKQKTFRSEPYKAFIRSKPCLMCYRDGVEAHHEPLGKTMMGGKPPDTHCVPLCHKCHQERHNLGVKTFWGNIDIQRVIIGLLTEFMGQDVEWEPIEKAPIDGTLILGCDEDGTMECMEYSIDFWHVNQTNIIFKPICWMPLPKGPHLVMPDWVG